MNKTFYIGSYRDDGLNEPNRGWIVGKFKDRAPRKNDEVEIKYWEFEVGFNDHPAKESEIIECTFILSGKTKGFIGDNEITLQTGDYVVIQPGTPNNIVAEILEPTTGLTVKAPSDPTAKKVLS